MTSTAQTVATTALETAVAVAAVTNPQAAAVVALAPIALQFLQSATQLQQAGAMTPEQLTNMFRIVGAGVQSTHDRWAALNK
jgi:hypothetical protein